MTSYESAALPQWLKNELPDMHPFYAVHVENGLFTARNASNQLFVFNEDNGTTRTTFETLDDIYDAIRRVQQVNFTIDDSILSYVGTTDDDKVLLFGKPGTPKYNRLYLFYTEKESLDLLESDYAYFLELDKKYRKKPHDFYTSYEYVTAHPAFWVKESEDNSWHWETSHTFEMFPLMRDSTVQWYLECGSHDETSGYTRHYLDTDLMTKAPTIEQAFIDLAQKVNTKFDSEGNEKQK